MKFIPKLTYFYLDITYECRKIQTLCIWMVVVKSFDRNFSLSPYIVVTAECKLHALDIERTKISQKIIQWKRTYFDQVGSGRYI